MTRISLDCQFRTLFQNGVCKLCVTLQFCLFLCRWKGFMINSSIYFVIAAKGKLPCYLCRRPLQIQRQDRPHIDESSVTITKFKLMGKYTRYVRILG